MHFSSSTPERVKILELTHDLGPSKNKECPSRAPRYDEPVKLPKTRGSLLRASHHVIWMKLVAPLLGHDVLPMSQVSLELQ